MKKIIFSTCIVLLLTIAACKKDEGLTAQEKVTAMLTASWHNPIVTVDEVDYSDLYVNFSISFLRGSYTTASGSPMWNTAGTWAFLNEEATLIKIDGVREVEIISISNEVLELSFQWDQNTFDPGRINSIRGKQRFRLKKR